MNQMPPGGPGWEPPWMQEIRDLEAAVNGHAKEIRWQVDRYIKLRKRDFILWFVGGLSGYWAGFLTAELVRWAALK